MALLIENYLNEVQLAGGINTNKPATFGGTVTFTGGRVNNYISNSTSTTLTAAQSGTTVIFNQAAGITYTLPAPQVGLSYNFKVLTSVTSLTDKIITSGGAFLIGPAIIGVAAGTTTAYFGDGSTIVSVNMNGTTTGGLLGSYVNFTCISATEWAVEGILYGSGTSATPFANS